MIEDAEIIEIIRGKAIVKIDGKALLLDMSDSTNINTNNPAPEPISASRNFRQQQIISNATGNIPKKSSSSKKITIRMPKNTLKNTITTGEKD